MHDQMFTAERAMRRPLSTPRTVHLPDQRSAPTLSRAELRRIVAEMVG